MHIRVLQRKSEDVELFVGRTNGRIVKARGKTEFDGTRCSNQTNNEMKRNRKTYGEMEKEEKNTISHRFRALEKLRKAKSSITKETRSDDDGDEDDRMIISHE